MRLRFPVTRLHFAFGLLILMRAFTDGFISVGTPSTLHAKNRLHSNGPLPEVSSDMRLGAFSVSLAVKDIDKSREFYEQLGFRQVMGQEGRNWLILRNGETTIGLFQGPFERNTLTFNPGWTSQNQPLEDFDDVRTIQQWLKAGGLLLAAEVDESTTGPASLMLLDPDGNPVLVDQHVASPKRP
jgi:catechol 2,3-dioxygenase-like lactoylglutathione lyase family enzyme